MTNRKYTHRRYLDALNERVLISDGAMGTSLQAQNLTAEHFGGGKLNGCNDYLVISYPQAVETVHRSFLEVGVDVIETDTFRANRLTMAEYGLQDRVIEINCTAAALARRLADEYSNTPVGVGLVPAQAGQPQESPLQRFVAGSIGPSGKLPSADDPELSNVSFDELADVFREQATGLIRGGVDVLLIETSQDILEVKAAITGIQKAFEETDVYLPIQAQVTLDTTGRMLLGTDIAAALTILEDLPIDVIGLNCSTGPEHMREPIRILGEQSSLPVSCIPNAGLPLNVDGQAVYPLEPEPFAEALTEFVEKHNISVVGGCCGTTPAHLKQLVDKLHGRPHPPRPALSTPRLSSSISATTMRQDPPPLLIAVEMDPPRGLSTHKLVAGASLLADAGADVINVADSPMARMRMSAWAVCDVVQRQVGVETTLHFPTRGRNLLRVQGDLLAAHALGVHNVFVVMGDPTSIGDYPEAMDNYDLVPSGLIKLIKQGFNVGMDHSGTSIGQPTDFFVGAALNLNPPEPESEIKNLHRKVKNGADFFLTQPIYRPEDGPAFLEKYAALHGPLDRPVLAGILPSSA